MQIRSNEVEENRKGCEDRREGPISIYTFHILLPRHRKTILLWNEHVATCDKGPPLATTKRFLSTRLLTPSSIVFQPIFLLSRTQIRVNGCNYPYPTASASSSSPPRQTNARLEERKKRYSSNNKRTVKICIRPLFLSVQPTFICLSVAGKLMEREMGGEKKEGGEVASIGK